MILLRSLAAWLLILAFAMLNGAFREAILLPSLGKPAALVLSGALLSACIVIVAVVLTKWMALDGAARSLEVGALWLLLTLAFEFGFGRLVQERPWPEMLEAYTFEDGNIWPLVLAVTFLAPLFAPRLRGHDRRTA
jgi:hypothetical protein